MVKLSGQLVKLRYVILLNAQGTGDRWGSADCSVKALEGLAQLPFHRMYHIAFHYRLIRICLGSDLRLTVRELGLRKQLKP